MMSNPTDDNKKKKVETPPIKHVAPASMTGAGSDMLK